jgi:cell division protein FtsI (penicillin-binding protein 3)
LSTVSFGHGIGVTPLQISNAFAAIANGGKLLRPYLVRKIIDSENNVIEQRSPEVVRQVLSNREATTLTLMLSGATQTGGTGFLARVDGYPVAGKTGTAQKVNPNGRGYLKGSYISSFAGFVPASQPQFVIFIAVDNPKKFYYGAQVAAPVFNRLASFGLRKRGFMPTVVGEKTLAAGQAPESQRGEDAAKEASRLSEASVASDTVPDFRGLTVREVAKRLKGAGPKSGNAVQIQLIGTGTAETQWPPAGHPWGNAPRVKVYFRNSF